MEVGGRWEVEVERWRWEVEVVSAGGRGVDEGE